MKIRAAFIGGLLGLILSLALVAALLIQQNPVAILFVLPALLGSGAEILWADRRWVAAAAAVGVAFSGMMFAIGGVGLLYIPTLILFLVGITQRRRQHAAVRGGTVI